MKVISRFPRVMCLMAMAATLSGLADNASAEWPAGASAASAIAEQKVHAGEPVKDVLASGIASAADVATAVSIVAGALPCAETGKDLVDGIKAALGAAKPEHRWAVAAAIVGAGGYSPSRQAAFAAVVMAVSENKEESTDAVLAALPESHQAVAVKIAVTFKGADVKQIRAAAEKHAEATGNWILSKRLVECDTARL